MIIDKRSKERMFVLWCVIFYTYIGETVVTDRAYIVVTLVRVLKLAPIRY